MTKFFPLSIIIILLLISVFSSCKKGENDPVLSLKSRKARLCQTWKVTREEGISRYNEYGHYTYSNSCDFSYDGNYKLIHVYGENPIISTAQVAEYTPYDETYSQYCTDYYTFHKDGTFEYTSSNTTTTEKTEYKGIWVFLSADNSMHTKNKEAIRLTYNSCYSTNSSGTSSSDFPDHFLQTKTILIDELKSKDLTLIQDESIDYSSYYWTSNTKEKSTIKLTSVK